jgi:tetratricopeptide (TPR) repeat protein
MTLTAVATATTFAACEDVPRPQPTKPSTIVSPEPSKPMAEPTPVPTPTPTPVTVPETVKKPDPIVETDKPLAGLEGARKLLADGSDLDKALELAKEAVTKSPKRSAAWNTLGRVQLQMGKRKEAIGSFQKAVELNPHNSYAQNNLGLALIYDKRYGDAVEALEEAVELEPVEGYMWNNLGMAYEQLDRLEEARDAYGKAVEMENDRAKGSLARLKGVKSVIRTAKVETNTTVTPDTKSDTTVEPPTTTNQ